MSTQLILYPQTYKGVFSSTSSTFSNQFIVNGLNFTGLNSTTLYNTTSATPASTAISDSPPSIIGDWYRFTTTGGSWGAVTAPQETSGNLQLNYNATAGHTGIYQQLSGLIVGAVFEFDIQIATPAVSGTITIQTYSGNILQSSHTLPANLSGIATQFTANTANDIILISYSGTASALVINSIQLNESQWVPTTIYQDLLDGQVICDLYQEEDIPLTLSVDDFKNVAEQVKSYSKDFNLPATKRNNRIFNNMFDITRTLDPNLPNAGLQFNPYVKTKCVLKQDGLILFEGYLRLIDIKDKNGEISYNVNLYSEVIALADLLKDATFEDLDFSELTHTYDKQSIKATFYEPSDGIGLPLLTPLPTSSFAYETSNQPAYGASQTNVLKYPFIDWTHQYIVGGTNPVGTGATAGNPELTSLEQVFRPCVQLKYLINKIFAAAGFNWTSNFFDSAEFGKLFMDFNWGAGSVPVAVGVTNYQQMYAGAAGLPAGTNYATTSFTPLWFSNNVPLVGDPTPPNYDPATFIITSTVVNETYQISSTYLEVENTDSVSRTVEFQWLYNSTPINYTSITLAAGATYAYTGTFSQTMINIGDTLQVQFKASSAGVVKQIANAYILTTVATIGVGLVSGDGVTLLTLRGELGQWDFLKGIMTMFNLVTMVDESDPNNILIEPYSDIFIANPNSTRLDWTDKVDASEMELKPLTDLNKTTIFKFVEDDDDYAFNVFKEAQFGHLYGSLEIDSSTSSNNMPTIFQGIKEIIAEPFAATVSKALMSQFSNFIVPSIYAISDDGTAEGFENSPRIFYNNGHKNTGASYYIPEQNLQSSENQTHFLQFSHLSDIPTIASSRDFVFASSQLAAGLGNPPVDNLFQIYWSPYFNELYNADTRTMTLKVNLNASDIATFKFYDTVFIKNRSFRVNKIEYKPNSLAKVEFILIP